jgi:regulator of RNase E activity RraA
MSQTQLKRPEPITEEQYHALRRVCSPTIANAIETFDVVPRGEGYTDAGIRCLFPEHGPMLGYACTATILSGQPAAPKRLVRRKEYWEYTRSTAWPKITVMQDLGERPGAAYWGEVNSNIHLALGSLGLITNGAVRDLEEVQRTGFHFFASGVGVSHGFAHLEDFNRPVRVFGMTVNSGDLVHADRHGAVIIPHEVLPHLMKAVQEIERSERVIIDLCRSKEFSIEALDKLVTPEY